MATQADGNRVSLRISKETNWGETPSTPTMKRVPYVSETIGHRKRTVQSNVVRSDRQRDAQVQVGVSADGDIVTELRFTDFLDFFEIALMNNWVSDSQTGAGTSNNFGFAAASGGTQVITGPSGWTNAFVVNNYARIRLAAQAANNGAFQVTAKNATTLTVKNASGVSETNSVAVISTKYIRNGVVPKSALIEKQFEDLTNVYENFRGMRIGGFSMNVTAEEIVTITWRFIGKQGHIATATVSGSLTPASSDDSMNASLNVGNILEGGVSLSTAIQSITMEYNNNMASRPAIGQVSGIGVRAGSVEITGRVNAYFEDATMLTKAFNHTVSGLSWMVTDPSGNAYVFTIGRLRFTGDVNGPGLNSDVMLPMDYAAERDPTGDYMLQIEALAIS